MDNQSLFGCRVSFLLRGESCGFHTGRVSQMPLAVLTGRGWFNVPVYIYFSHIFSVSLFWLSMNVFFPGVFAFTVSPSLGLGSYPFCFLWMDSLTYFLLQIRVRHEHVSGFTWLSVWLSLAAVWTYSWHSTVFTYFNQPFKKHFCCPPTMNLTLCLDLNQSRLFPHSSSDGNVNKVWWKVIYDI